MSNINMIRYAWLEAKLDSETLSEAEYDLYNTELNDLQELINQAKFAKKQLEINKIEAIKCLIKEGKMDQMIDDYGSEFIEDYVIDDNNFTVTSLCYNQRNPNGTNFWQLADHSECVLKVRTLVYYRIYDHYFRNADKDEKYA